MSEKNFLEEYAGKGFENIEAEDFQIPFLKILPPNATQCIEGHENFISGAKPGMFFNSLNQKIYGDTVEVVPLDVEKVWIEWQPDRGGFVARHKPNSVKVDKSNYSKWVTSEGNEIKEYYNFYCYINNHYSDGIVVFSLYGSSLEHARNWNTQIVNTFLPESGNQAPFYSSVWELKTVFNQKNSGSWYAIGMHKKSYIKRIRFISLEEFEKFIKPGKESLEFKSFEGGNEETETLKIEGSKDLLHLDISDIASEEGDLPF